MDKAIRRFAGKDHTELGCADYIVGKKKASYLTLFVHGNHGDFDFLLGAGYTHIDPFGLIQHLSLGRMCDCYILGIDAAKAVTDLTMTRIEINLIL